MGGVMGACGGGGGLGSHTPRPRYATFFTRRSGARALTSELAGSPALFAVMICNEFTTINLCF